MTPTKEQVKEWLKSHGHDRAWLAEQLGGISKRAVDNWFASAGVIPASKLNLIAQLMESTERQPEETKVAVAVLMTASQRARILEAARRCGQTLDDFITTAAQERADGILGAFSESESAS